MTNDRKAKLTELFNALSEHEKIEVHTMYCDENNATDQEIFCMSDFDELMKNSGKLSDIINKLDAQFNILDNYFYFDALARINSINALVNCPHFDVDEIIEFVDEKFEKEEILDLNPFFVLLDF